MTFNVGIKMLTVSCSCVGFVCVCPFLDAAALTLLSRNLQLLAPFAGRSSHCCAAAAASAAAASAAIATNPTRKTLTFTAPLFASAAANAAATAAVTATAVAPAAAAEATAARLYA